jgi:hypothetical protein
MTALAKPVPMALALTTKHAVDVAHIEPTWGMYDRRHSWNTMPVTRPVPSIETLEKMQAELVRALAPIKDTGEAPAVLRRLAEAATTLIDSYPQRDGSTPTYAQQIIKRLAECPPDLIEQVIDRLVDEHPDFRPGPGRVAEMVRRVVAKRALTLMRVQAALRWHETREQMQFEDLQIAHDKAAAAARAAERESRGDSATFTPFAAAVYGAQEAANDDAGMTTPASPKTA